MEKNYNKKFLQGNTVYVDGDFNRALRKFKKRVEESGVLQDLMEKQHYVKPSERKKKAKGAARARWLKKQSQEKLPPKNY
jgi:small subunit ribosomal protein S21